MRLRFPLPFSSVSVYERKRFEVGNHGLRRDSEVLQGGLAASAFSLNACACGYIGGARVLGVPGTANTFAGVGAGAANTSGSFNAALGSNALQNNTTGFNNVAVGSSALQSNTTGVDNTSMGANSLIANVGGGRNSAIGSGALQSNTAGNFNTAMGVLASFGNTTGNANSAYGVATLFSNTTGDSNTAIGVRALQNNTTGSRNTAIGASALQNSTTANVNTAVGYRAMHGNTSGANNTALGAFAGLTNTSGMGNTFIGANADAGAGALSNASAIGQGAQVAQDNSLVLGSINGVNGAVADVNVGIGSTTPSQKLEVRNGNVLLSNSGAAGELQLAEPGGTDYTALRAGTQTGNITYTLPTSLPAADGQVLTSTTTGTMGWSADMRVDAAEGLVRMGGGFGMVLGDPDTDDDGLLDGTGDATVVPFGTLRYDASADKIQAFVSDSDGGGTDGWINLH